MLEASELLSPTPKRDAKEEQHFPMKPKGLTLSSFFLALSMRPLGKSRKLASPFSDDAPIYFTLSRLLGHRMPEGCSLSAHIRHRGAAGSGTSFYLPDVSFLFPLLQALCKGKGGDGEAGRGPRPTHAP